MEEKEEVKALSTCFTSEHLSINENFIKRVVQLLDSVGNEPTTYGINKDRWEERESLKLNLTENRTLEITLRCAK